jgi:LysR family hydrogen peroxide-inducible transcriptional activator
MNIRDLKYLIAIADHNHFGKAAESCFVSQPALSMQIKKLEKILGVQLIERTNKSLYFTDIGKRVTQHARDIIYHTETIRHIAHQAKDPYHGELKLGIIPTIGPYLLPYIIPILTKKLPHLKIFLYEEKTEKLISELKKGNLDAAIFGLPLIENDFHSMPLFEEELTLAVPTHHALSKLTSISQTQLANKTLLLLQDGHCLRDQALSLCHSNHASIDHSFQATSLETLRHMVASNAGITLMPKLACKEYPGIQYLSFSSPKPTRQLGIIWRPSTAKMTLLEYIGNEIKTILLKQKSIKVIKNAI